MPDIDDKISALYEESKSRSEPPEQLDSAIREAARREAKYRHRRIYSAFGLAATLVLGVGVAWMNITTAPDLVSPTTEEESSISAPSPASVVTPEPAQAAKRALSLDVGPTPQARLQPQAATPLAESAMKDFTGSGLFFESTEERALTEPLAECASELHEASIETWVETIENARAANNDDLSQCLEREFIKLFGHRPEKSGTSQER